MDAAKGATGHGWPFAPGLWSNDGVRAPAAGGPDAWGKPFCLLLGRLPKVRRRKGGTNRSNNAVRRSDAALKATAKASRLKPRLQKLTAGRMPTHNRCWVSRRLGALGAQDASTCVSASSLIFGEEKIR
jgi:hypothetical protein